SLGATNRDARVCQPHPAARDANPQLVCREHVPGLPTGSRPELQHPAGEPPCAAAAGVVTAAQLSPLAPLAFTGGKPKAPRPLGEGSGVRVRSTRPAPARRSRPLRARAALGRAWRSAVVAATSPH